MIIWLKPIGLTLAAMLVVATLLPLWRHDAWWVRACDFPRAQIVVLGLILTLGYLALPGPRTGLEKAVLALVGLSLAFQVYQIHPYTPAAREQVLRSTAPPPGASLSLLMANVLMDNRRADRLLDLVRRWSPDVVLTVETDDWWEERLRVLEDDYPFTVKKPLSNTYGMLLHSRTELIEPEVKYLLEPDIPSIHARIRLPMGAPVQLHFLHPRPPHPAESLETTERDAELLIVGREAGRSAVPTVVAGDLNDVAWSHTTRLFQRLSGLLDPRIGRGLYSTYHARIPLLRWPLDHVFHSVHFKLVRLERLPAFGSDHFPVFAELSLEPAAPIVQDEPRPEPGDLEEAEEKIEEGEPLDVP